MGFGLKLLQQTKVLLVFDMDLYCCMDYDVDIAISAQT